MKNLTGPPARGEDFYKRTREIDEIKKAIDSYSHIQIAAPRRVGKTSILMYFKDNPMKDYYSVFVDVESVSSENDYFKKLYEELMRSEAFSGTAKIFDQLLERGNQFLGRIKSFKIAGQGIELSDSPEIDYCQELTNLLKGINLHGKKIVMMVDEFPEVILTIYNSNNKDEGAVVRFLKMNRAMRQDPDINQKIVFVYTGSIGLNHTVSRFQASAAINDLKSIGVGPLKKEEALELINLIVQEQAVTIDALTSEYLLSKIEWYIPFHIQLAISESTSLIRKGEEITIDIIDEAFRQIIDYRNNNAFEHYETRLAKSLEKDELDFANEVLEYMVHHSTIESATIHDFAVKHNLENKYRPIIGLLVYDGYINNNDDNNIFCFNSPILKMWWQKYVCK